MTSTPDLAPRPQPFSETERAELFKTGPPKFPRRYLWLAIAIIAVLGIGGAFADQSFNVPSVAPKQATSRAKAVSNTLAHFVGLRLLTATPAPRLPLFDQTGAAFSLASLRGRVVLLTFLDPFCRDICPVLASELREAAARLGPRRGSIAVVVINADPGDATPAASVGALSRDRLASLPDPYFLSGSLGALNRIWASYGVTVEYNSANGQLAHTNVLYVITRSGKLDYALEPFGNESPAGRFSLPKAQLARFASGIAYYAERAQR